MKSVVHLYTGLALFLAMPILSEEKSAEKPETRHALEKYLRDAAVQNDGLRAAFEKWKAAEQKIDQARSLPDPRFTYAYFVEEVETRVGPQKQKLGIMQSFPWYGKRKLRASTAEQMAMAAHQDYLSAKWKLFMNVQKAYADYWVLERSIAVTEQHKTLVTNLEKVARTRYRLGAAPHSAVVQMQVQLGTLEDRLRSLDALREALQARLNAILNKPLDDKPAWAITMPTLTITLADDRILELFEEMSPELSRIEHMTEAAEHKRQLAEKAGYPDISLGLDYVDTGESANPSDPDSGKDPLMAMISMNIPLWSGKYRAQKKEALHERDSLQAMQRNAEVTLKAGLKMALYSFHDAGRKIEFYRNTMIPKAEQALNVARQEFETGKGGFLELIDAERMLLEYRLQFDKAQADRLRVLGEVEAIVGKRISTIRSAE